MGSEESTITASYVPSGTAFRNATPASARSRKALIVRYMNATPAGARSQKTINCKVQKGTERKHSLYTITNV